MGGTWERSSRKPYRYWKTGTEGASTGGSGHQGGAPTLSQWRNSFILYSNVIGDLGYINIMIRMVESPKRLVLNTILFLGLGLKI